MPVSHLVQQAPLPEARKKWANQLGRIDPLSIEGIVVALAGFGCVRWHARLAADQPTRRGRRARRRG